MPCSSNPLEIPDRIKVDDGYNWSTALSGGIL